MRKLILLAALLVVAATAQADPILTSYVGANGLWDDEVTPRPNDFEVGGGVAASLQPHVSLVGNGYYGFERSYVRGYLGARFTASNVDDPNFSIGLGGGYNLSSEPNVRPEGFSVDASMGFVPWPVNLPAVTIIAQGGYFPKTNNAQAIVGARYTLGGGH